jgi:hypothetical protein
MGLSAEYKGQFRYFSNEFAEAAVAAAQACHDEAVKGDGGCSLSMEGIERHGDTVRVRWSVACPASIAFGADHMLLALASTALDGSATATVEYETKETTTFRAQGTYAPHRHASWPADPEQRADLVQHLFGRHMLQRLDMAIQQGLFHEFPRDQHEKLRRLSLGILSTIVEGMSTDGNFVDGDDEAAIWYKLTSRVETCQGEHLEDVEILSPQVRGLWIKAEEDWRKGRIG